MFWITTAKAIVQLSLEPSVMTKKVKTCHDGHQDLVRQRNPDLQVDQHDRGDEDQLRHHQQARRHLASAKRRRIKVGGIGSWQLQTNNSLKASLYHRIKAKSIHSIITVKLLGC